MTIPATMRALEQTTLNGPHDLRLITDAPVPTPAEADVLIRVRGRRGQLRRHRASPRHVPRRPATSSILAGFEVAGEVVATGASVTGLERGDQIVGVGIGCGTFAEYTALPAAAVMPLPDGWSAEQALGLMVNWPTAVAALRPLGRLAAGETVLIHAAAGATGQAAVRIAKHDGARRSSPPRHRANTTRCGGSAPITSSTPADPIWRARCCS